MYENVYGFGGPYLQQNTVAQNDPKSFCQTLTVEQANALRKHTEEFSLSITEHDKWRAICMHRDPATGQSTLSPNKIDGTVTCLICGETFNFVDSLKPEDIENATANLLDVIQSSKVLYLDMPPESAATFYTIIAMIKKIPGLYKVACGNFASHEAAAGMDYVNGPGLINAWQQLNAGMFGFPNMGMNMGMTNPNMGMGMPMTGNVYGAPVNSGGNPFFTNPQAQPQPMMQPMMGGYTPQVQQYAYNPMATPTQATQAATVAQPGTTVQPMPAAPATPGAAQPVAAAATTDGSNVNVTNTFKA